MSVMDGDEDPDPDCEQREAGQKPESDEGLPAIVDAISLQALDECSWR